MNFFLMHTKQKGKGCSRQSYRSLSISSLKEDMPEASHADRLLFINHSETIKSLTFTELCFLYRETSERETERERRRATCQIIFQLVVTNSRKQFASVLACEWTNKNKWTSQPNCVLCKVKIHIFSTQKRTKKHKLIQNDYTKNK